jgi:hypothetical protein
MPSTVSFEVVVNREGPPDVLLVRTAIVNLVVTHRTRRLTLDRLTATTPAKRR